MLEANFLQTIGAILIAITIHEASHAYIAHLLGDNTAKNEGRITLNPIKHLDLWGSLLFLFIGIGWGKPVPINPHYFKNPKMAQALVAFAGPASNFLLAALIAIPLPFVDFANYLTLKTFLIVTLELNVTLCALNLLPIPPLDGSKILAILIPQKHYYKYTEFLNSNLTYIIVLFMADIYLFKDLLGFSFILTFIDIMSGLIKTVIFLGT